MKKTLLALLLLFSAGSLMAGEAGDWKGWYGTFLKGLKTKVSHRLESKTRVTAVAAVRGAKQGSDPRALYWKGGVSDQAQKKLDAEKKQLTDAVQLVMDGNIEDGRQALAGFTKNNPDSVFLQDAKEALEKLPAAGKPAVKPAPPADEGKPGAKTGNSANDGN